MIIGKSEVLVIVLICLGVLAIVLVLVFIANNTIFNQGNELISAKKEYSIGELKFAEAMKICNNSDDFKVQCKMAVCSSIGLTDEKINNCKNASRGIDSCLMMISPKNSNVCENILDSKGINNLRDSCYKEIAEKTKNYSLCNEISEASKKVLCFKEVARIVKNPSICDEINSLDICPDSGSFCMLNYRETKTNCGAVASSDASKCIEIDFNADFKCLMDIARETKNLSLCDEIKTSLETQSELREACILGVAQEAKNPDICVKIGYQMIKNECLTKSQKDISGCEQTASTGKKDDCFYDLALENRDLSICNKISRENIAIKSLCTADVISSVTEELNSGFNKENILYQENCIGQI